jgi:hypothetical protein
MMSVLGAATLISVSTMLSPSAQAGESMTARLLNSRTITEAFDRAYFKHDRNFYRNQKWDRQAAFLGNFWPPENEIAWDARLVNAVYQDVLAQQGMSDPYMRVADLPSPYCTSLLSSYSPCAPAMPAPEPAPAPEPQPMLPPPAPAPVRPAPIPALW